MLIYVKFIIESTLTMLFRLSQVIMVWRCAFNCGWKIWGYIARALILVFAYAVMYGFITDIIYIVNKAIMYPPFR